MITFESTEMPMRTTVENGFGLTEIRDRSLARAIYAALKHAKNDGKIRAILIEHSGYVEVSIEGSGTTINLHGVQ